MSAISRCRGGGSRRRRASPRRTSCSFRSFGCRAGRRRSEDDVRGPALARQCDLRDPADGHVVDLDGRLRHQVVHVRELRRDLVRVGAQVGAARQRRVVHAAEPAARTTIRQRDRQCHRHGGHGHPAHQWPPFPYNADDGRRRQGQPPRRGQRDRAAAEPVLAAQRRGSGHRARPPARALGGRDQRAAAGHPLRRTPLRRAPPPPGTSGPVLSMVPSLSPGTSLPGARCSPR
jgi:hypothetical protein